MFGKDPPRARKPEEAVTLVVQALEEAVKYQTGCDWLDRAKAALKSAQAPAFITATRSKTNPKGDIVSNIVTALALACVVLPLCAVAMVGLLNYATANRIDLQYANIRAAGATPKWGEEWMAAWSARQFKRGLIAAGWCLLVGIPIAALIEVVR